MIEVLPKSKFDKRVQEEISKFCERHDLCYEQISPFAGGRYLSGYLSNDGIKSYCGFIDKKLSNALLKLCMKLFEEGIIK